MFFKLKSTLATTFEFKIIRKKQLELQIFYLATYKKALIKKNNIRLKKFNPISYIVIAN